MKIEFIATVFVACTAVTFSKAQVNQISDLDRGILIGNLLIQGYQALKGPGDKSNSNSKSVDSFCFKNKMDEKITVRLNGKVEDEEIKKELVIQKDTKECTFDLPKGIYTYEILLSSKDIYKKGEYNVAGDTLMTINHD